MNVKPMMLIIAASMMAACASGVDPSDTGMADKTQPIFLDCSNGWAKCVSTANEICGSRGYDEVDRMQDAYMTASGRLDDHSDGRHVYREDVRLENQNQTMVIQCR